MKELIEYFDEFTEELRKQIIEDNKRWGNTWIERGKAGQEMRFYDWVSDKLENHYLEGLPFPWLKIAGEAMIGYIREKYME